MIDLVVGQLQDGYYWHNKVVPEDVKNNLWITLFQHAWRIDHRCHSYEHVQTFPPIYNKHDFTLSNFKKLCAFEYHVQVYMIYILY